jgi:hypothetical protein
MSLVTRLQRSIQTLFPSSDRQPINYDTVQKQLDTMISSGELSVGPLARDYTPVAEKAQGSKSKLDVRSTSHDLVMVNLFGVLREWYGKNTERIPLYDDPSRDIYLSNMWREEPILAGAVYSMTAKMTALKWSITGRRRVAKQAAQLFASAAHMGGYDWGGFVSSTAEDFYTTNRGVFWETPRDGNYLYGKLAAIGHIDSLACELTGNSKHPVVYRSEVTGQTLRFRPGEIVHFSSLPSPREIHFGMGFCAVDRALRAVQLLMGLHDYDAEKLANLPPEGVAAITGLTMDEFQDALNLWRAARERDKSLTFPQVLWLIGSQPNVEVKVSFHGFSQIPESFDRQTVITQYISTLALDFGVDAREFWPISSGSLGTAAESEIQHLKAKGKGPGEFISITERNINAELPEDANFSYDTQDIAEDVNAAAAAQAWITALFPLTTAGGAGDEILTKEQFLRMLADHGVIPDYVVQDDRVAIEDSDIHLSKEGYGDDYTKYTWDKGVLKEERVPPIFLYSAAHSEEDVPFALVDKKDIIDTEFHGNGYKDVQEALDYLEKRKEEILEEHRNIHGEPIPEAEVVRGSRITKTTIRDELERWRKDPILSKYVTTVEEEITSNESNT